MRTSTRATRHTMSCPNVDSPVPTFPQRALCWRGHHPDRGVKVFRLDTLHHARHTPCTMLITHPATCSSHTPTPARTHAPAVATPPPQCHRCQFTNIDGHASATATPQHPPTNPLVWTYGLDVRVKPMNTYVAANTQHHLQPTFSRITPPPYPTSRRTPW